jgi:Flp pilus assembly protein TadB
MTTLPQLTIVILGIWLAAMIALGWLMRRMLLRSHVTRRMYDEAPRPVSAARDAAEERSSLGRWLYLAGIRGRYATGSFVVLTAAAGLAGLGIALILWSQQANARLLDVLTDFPGGIGDLLVPFVYLAPWLIAVLLACLPWLYVRHARRNRVEQIEQDLPLTLDLLAMLGESGLGFDAALERVLHSQPAGRPLVRELRTFQLDTLAGRPRVECFRRLARRVEISALNVFVSALVQAEQVGAGSASVLRRQADDLRERRREDAMATALAMPVKRLFPLIICFLPGIFVAALGPTAYEFFQYADTVIQLRDFEPTR